MSNGSTSWQQLAQQKRAARDSLIPSEWFSKTDGLASLHLKDVTEVPNTYTAFLSKKEIEITNTPILELQVRLGNGSWSAVEVTTAYLKRAVVAHRLTNCLTEVFFDRALERATFLDAHFRKTGRVLGPFHGVPISLKDQHHVKDIDTTLGFIAWVGNKAEKNSIMVDLLENAGAVLFAKTNIPQTMMWTETYNNLFGRTVNPFNRTLTCGGSSGGEGALISMHGSALGVGTDIGGSIRVPASFCGLYGLRPSFDRLPYTGLAHTTKGQDRAVPTVIGPISPSLDGVKLFFQSILEQRPWTRDPYCIRKSWNEGEYRLSDHGGESGRLCFGIMWDDESIVPHPPVLRAMNTVKKALEQQGHKVIPWKAYKHRELCDTLRAIWTSGSAEDLKAPLIASGEPRIKNMDPDWVPDPAPRTSDSPKPRSSPTAPDMWKIYAKRREQQREYLDLWEESVKDTGTGRPIDAIIAPVAPGAAPPHGKNGYVDYTMIWNTLDYPALAIPVTKVDSNLDAKPSATRKFKGTLDRIYNDLYDPEHFKNAPVGIQLVARTLEEEALIRMGEMVEKALQGRKSKL